MRRVLFLLASFLLVLAVSASVARADQPEPTKEPHGRPTEVGPQLHPNKPESNKAEEKQDEEKGNKRHGIFGTIKTVSDGGMTVTAKQGDVDVTFGDKTKFHVPTKRDATAGNLAVGDRVAVNGTWSGDSFVAKKVAVAPGKPTVQHRVGTVEAYTAGDSITIKTVQGDTETFKLSSDVEIRGPKGVTSVSDGDRVTVVAGRAPGAESPTARAIVVHPN